jgi:hypothetical protein
LVIELFSIFFDNRVSLIQHEISLLSERSNFRLIKNRQNFLIKSFYGRLLAVRNYVESQVSGSLRYLSSREKFTVVLLLYQRKDLIKHYNFYVIKSKGTAFTFNFYILYFVSFCNLIKFSILPFLETKFEKPLFTSRPYKIKSDVILKITDILLKDFNRLWYLKFKIPNILNFTNKSWLLRNFPLEKNFLNFYFEQKHYSFCKSFYLMIFNYLLTGLV